LLDVVIRNAKRLQQFAEDILDVTKIEGHSLKLNIERFNLNDLISNAVQECRNQIEKEDNSNVKLLYEPNKDDFVIEADRYRITQVIYNLISNAIKFTKEGVISITVVEKKNDEQVIVSIKDTGPGIDAEILPRLFSKFVTKSFEGSGLGLFICKSIVEAHGGQIWAENNNNADNGEKGATFTFSLPITVTRSSHLNIVSQE
jgi:signal transduction histidine kinase